MICPSILPLQPNRVWRSYSGGRLLDEREGVQKPTDTHFPEDWIASTTRATNPGREDGSEGVSTIVLNGAKVPFDELLAADPHFYLGSAYVSRYGYRVAPLVKFLDPAIRLHFQCHPTVPFAQQHFGSDWGKTEAYHILQIRPDNPDPHIYLGFQRPPSREETRRMVLEQDMNALEACFDPIRVEVGETYFVPGGLPHAIGAGVLMIEVMEPTDFVARFEWEKAGYVLPEAARFMGRDVEFGLDMLDFSVFSVDEVRSQFQTKPQKLDDHRALLLGKPHTSSFRLEKWEIQGEMSVSLDSFAIAIVLEGACEVRTEDEKWTFEKFGRFFVPAGLQKWQICGDAEILMIFPPASP